ncbi:MAG: hypothetical protein RBT71_09590 [Flavobacteriales bacterium]|jgi:hypothetical protein|nr:hypothetical protein [Flavobacteriales bacterium]
MDFHPPITSRTTAELLKISSDAESWQPDARALARMELDRRGVPAHEIEAREQEFKEAAFARHELREQHARESYSPGQMLGIFLKAPLLMLGKVFGGKFGFDVKLGLSDLDRRNYKRKYRQRMTLFVLWLVVFFALIAFF